MNTLKEIKCFLLDMDGTIYLGNKLIDGAKDFLSKLGREKYIFLTNNSSRSKSKYIEKLNSLGIEAVEDSVFSSADATMMYLKSIKSNPKVFLLGSPDLEYDFEKNNIELIKERNQEIDFVVLGFDTSLNYEKIWIACDYLLGGTPFIATHPDFVCPLENGKCMPDIGAMIEMFKAATGKSPLIIGKPERYMIDFLTQKYNLDKKDIAIVGDRLYTDIKTGKVNNIKSILVLSGETNIEMYEKSEIKADYVFKSVKEMIQEI